jgi:multimeric flavodoxin WrbA
MKAYLLNGAYVAGDATDVLAPTVLQALKDHAMPAKLCTLRDMDIAFCTGCFGCWTTNGGQCVVRDDGYDLAQEARQVDLLVLLTPVVFGGYGWQLKKAMDRLLPDLAPYFLPGQEPVPFQEFAALLGIGVQAQEDQAQASMLLSLVKRNAANYHSSSYAAMVTRAGTDAESFRSQLHGALSTLEAQR